MRPSFRVSATEWDRGEGERRGLLLESLLFLVGEGLGSVVELGEDIASLLSIEFRVLGLG